MGKTHRQRLQENHCRLKYSICARKITSILQEIGILTRDEVDKINRGVTEEERTEQLLFILARKDETSYEAFLQALKKVQEQEGLYKDIIQLLEGSDPEQGTQSAEQDEERSQWNLVQDSRKDIAERLDAGKACKHLVNGHILTEEESDAINAEETPLDRASSLLRVLPAKGPNAFSALCRVLHHQGQEEIASFLNGASASDALKPVTNVPKPVNNFLQTTDATNVQQALTDNKSITIVSAGICKLGKTQIARWVASQFLKHHPTAVVWVLDGQSCQTFLSSKRRLLAALNAEVPEEEDTTKVDECLDKALKDRGTPVLLIVKDLEDATLLTPTFLRERVQSRVMVLTHQKDLQLQAEVEDISHISVSGFSAEEVEIFLQGDPDKPDKQVYQTGFLVALNEAFNHRPLTWALVYQSMTVSHTSLENYVAELREGKTVMDIQEELTFLTRWMHPQYEKFDPLEESMQLRTAISKLSSTSRESTDKTSSDGLFMYGIRSPQTEDPQAPGPDHQTNKREDSATPQLENKDSHETSPSFQAAVVVEEKYETSLDEDDKDKTPNDTASAHCHESGDDDDDDDCPDEPISAPTSRYDDEQHQPDILVIQRTAARDQPPIPSKQDGLQTTHVATPSPEQIHAVNPQEQTGGSLENPSRQTSAESEHGIDTEDAAALPLEEPRCDSNETSTDPAFGENQCTVVVNDLSAQSLVATTSQVEHYIIEQLIPESELDRASSEEAAPTTPSSKDAHSAAHHQDITQPKGRLPTACIEGGIEVEGAVGGRCSPYSAQTVSNCGRPNTPCPEVQNVRGSLSIEGSIEVEGAVGGRCSPYSAQTVSQNETTSNCHSSRSNIPCPEVQNVRRAFNMSICDSWDLVCRHSEEIARRIIPRLANACRFLVDANVLTEDECSVIDREETCLERATTLLSILKAKDQNAFLEFCAALVDQGLEDIEALITGAQVSNILSPVTNVPKPVNNFLPTHDTNVVNTAVTAQHITVVCEVTGSGKTQIARWVASQFLKHHPTAVVWVLDGQNSQTFLSSKRRLLAALNAEVPEEEDSTKVDECLDKALKDRGTPVLLIVDQLQDAALLTPTFLRERIQSRVMILTHREDLQLPAETPFPCNLNGGFLTEEGVRFSQTVLEEADIPIDHLRCLTDVFEGSPLGLAAALEYMRVTKTSPEQYMLMLKEEQTARILQQEAKRFLGQHYTKFNQGCLHPVFQAAQNNVRPINATPTVQDESGEEISHPEDSSSLQSPESQLMGDEVQQQETQELHNPHCMLSEEAISSVLSQEGAVASGSVDEQETEHTTSSGDGCSLGASVTSAEEESELEGAVGGIYPPPRSRTASQPGLPRALAISIPPPSAHLARLAVPCQQVQQATRIVCQLLRLQQPGIQQVEGDMSSSGPPAFVVLENQEFPVLPASSQFVQEQTFGTVLVFSHPAEQRIATGRGHPQQFVWEIAVRNLTEVFDHNLESNFTFRYYVPRRPPDSLPFVPLDARIGTGTTVQAVAATDGANWAWRITSTQDGPELEIYMYPESSHTHSGACDNHRMASPVEPACLNFEHRSWRNSPLQQGPSPFVVALEAERERLRTHVGQGSIPVRVQRGDGAQIVQEIIDLYLRMPSAAACRLNVQFVGEPGIDCGGPGRELFMLVWRWLSERCLVNGIPCQSPNLEPSSYEFWLAVGRFTLHMFVLYNCFPVHLAKFVVEAMFNGAEHLRSVDWFQVFLDTVPANIQTHLFENCSSEAAFERNRDQLTEILMMWGVSSFPQSPAHLTRMVPRVGKCVCLDAHYVALCGLINGFREGWQGCVMPGDVDRFINRLRHPYSCQDIIQALEFDESNVDSDTGRRLKGYMNRWLQNANPTMLQQLLITATGCDQLPDNSVITIVFDPGYPNNAISSCAQTWPVPVVESYEDFCIYMTGVLSGNTFNHV